MSFKVIQKYWKLKEMQFIPLGVVPGITCGWGGWWVKGHKLNKLNKLMKLMNNTHPLTSLAAGKNLGRNNSLVWQKCKTYYRIVASLGWQWKHFDVTPHFFSSANVPQLLFAVSTARAKAACTASVRAKPDGTASAPTTRPHPLPPRTSRKALPRRRQVWS